MIYINGVAIVGDMTKAVYDPDLDGLIALAQLVAAVCSETEALAIAKSVVTKEFFIPIQSDQGSDLGLDLTYVVWLMNLSGDDVYANFKIPHDFTTLTSVKVVGIWEGTGTIDWTCVTTFAGVGELKNANTDSHTVDGEPGTTLEMEEVDISEAFSGIAADDWIGVQFTLDALTGTSVFKVCGIVFKYV